MWIFLYLWRTQDYTNQSILRSTVAIHLVSFIDRHGNGSSWCSVTVPPLSWSGAVKKLSFHIVVRLTDECIDTSLIFTSRYAKSGQVAKYIIEIKPKKQTKPPYDKNKRTAAYNERPDVRQEPCQMGRCSGLL